MNDQIVIRNDRKAVQKLIESIGDIIKISTVQKIKLTASDIDHINEIKACIQEIENDRFEGHEVLEKESIKHEALRNKLEHFPKEISNEIENAIKAARGMNEERIEELKAKLYKIDSNIEKYSSTLEHLNKENSELMPALEKMKLKHEEIVYGLNKHLAKKADRQINLNEIRNDIKNHNEEMVQLEESIVNLKEELTKERAIAREEQRILTKKTNEAQGELDIQKTKNEELLKIYNDLKHEESETSNTLNEKRQKIKDLVKSIGEMKKRREEAETSIDDMRFENSKLDEEMMNLDEKMAQSRVHFENWRSQIEEEIEMISESLKLVSQTKLELNDMKKITSHDLEKAQKVKDHENHKCKVIMNELHDVEDSTNSKLGDISQMEQEMTDMETKMIDDKEIHEAAVLNFEEQIQTRKTQFEKERKENNEIQRNQSNLQSEINQLKIQHSRKMKELNKKMEESKTEHSKLQNNFSSLQKSMKFDVSETKRLDQSIQESKENWKAEEKQLRDEISELNRQILNMEEDKSRRQNSIHENQPKLQELQTYVNKHKLDYDVMKKELVALKNRKNNLEDNIARSQKSIENETNNSLKLENSKKEQDFKFNEELDKEADERTGLEKKIYVTTCNISTLKEEIGKLEVMISKLEKKIDNLRLFWEKSMVTGSSLKKNISQQNENLKSAWLNGEELEKAFNSKEENEINRLKTLLSNTEERQKLIVDISDKMKWEIEAFGEYLTKLTTVSSTNKDDKVGVENSQSDDLTKAMEKIGIIGDFMEAVKDKMKLRSITKSTTN